jgi:hypothetical protein
MAAQCEPTLYLRKRSSACGGECEVRFARDSLLEQAGFELVWGFSCGARVATLPIWV